MQYNFIKIWQGILPKALNFRLNSHELSSSTNKSNISTPGNRKWFNAGIMAICLLILSSCYYDSEEALYPGTGGTVCDTSNVTFSGTIQPILQSNCNSCHMSSIASGGVITDNYQDLIPVVESGIFWKAVNHEPGASPMPQDQLPNKLPQCELDKIKAWINKGAPNN